MRKSLLLLLAAPLLIAIYACSAPGEVDFSQYEKSIFSQYGEDGVIEELFEEAGVPEDLDFLVIDIDSNDYYIWKVIHNFRPKGVQIEINPYFPPSQLVVIDFHPLNYWDYTDYASASIASMIKLGKKKGYEPVYNTGGFNLFFVDRKYYARFGIKDNSPEALYKKWRQDANKFNRHPEGRGEVPFSKPYLEWGPTKIKKKFIFGRWAAVPEPSARPARSLYAEPRA